MNERSHREVRFIAAARLERNGGVAFSAEAGQVMVLRRDQADRWIKRGVAVPNDGSVPEVVAAEPVADTAPAVAAPEPAAPVQTAPDAAPGNVGALQALIDDAAKDGEVQHVDSAAVAGDARSSGGNRTQSGPGRKTGPRRSP